MEKATFTPAVFLTTGGMSKECKRFVNRVADLIARKRKERYCDVVRHVRKNKIRNVKNHTRCSTRVQRKKIDKKYETPLSEVSYNLIMME